MARESKDAEQGKESKPHTTGTMNVGHGPQGLRALMPMRVRASIPRLTGGASSPLVGVGTATEDMI